MNQSMMDSAEEDEAGERGGGRTSASPVHHDEEAMKMRGFVRARRVGRDLVRFGGLIFEKTMAKQGQARKNTLKNRCNGDGESNDGRGSGDGEVAHVRSVRITRTLRSYVT